jgi:drug/metabolite transporter (DMT)-like permease
MDVAALGLASALCYGTGDYLWQVAGRAVGLWRSSFYGSLVGLLALTAWLILEPRVTVVAVTSAPRALLAALAAGVALEAGSVLLTQGLIRGSIAVVAPVTAGYGAVTTTLAVASGAFLAQRLERAGTHHRRRLHRRHTRAAPAIRRAHSQRHRLGDRRCCSPRTLAVGGFVTLTAGLATGQVAIVVVLSSLTSAITVLIARIFGAARVALHQWAAITVIVLGLILIHR